MGHIGPHHRCAAPISTFTDFAMKLSSVALPLAPTLEQIVFMRIKSTFTQRTWCRARRLWFLPEVLPYGIASQAQFFPDLAQAHPSCMQFLHPLIELPLA